MTLHDILEQIDSYNYREYELRINSNDWNNPSGESVDFLEIDEEKKIINLMME